jgi:O-antigen/teichoic acid export membrane protein
MPKRGRIATLTLIDQGLSSLSNFAVGVVIARVVGASGLGGFALAYAGWLILAALDRSLITDPMAIDGDVRTKRIRGPVEQGLAAELLMGIGGGVILAAIGGALCLLNAEAFGIAMLALAAWLPMLAAQDYWRWIGFLTRHPGRSLANDVVFNCAMAVALGIVFLTHVHSIAAVVGAWGLGATAGAIFGLRQYRVRPIISGGLALIRHRWSFSKWLAANSLVTSAGNQAYVVIEGIFLGAAGLGGLNAAAALVWGPVGVLIQAGGSLGLPEAGRAYADKGWVGLRRVANIVTLAGFLSVGLWVAVIFGWGQFLLSEVYGPSFAHLQVTAIICAIGLCWSPLLLGPVLVLKTTRNTRPLFRVQVFVLFVSLGSVAVLSALYGVNGAAGALIVTGVANVLLLRWFQYRVHRSVEQTEEDLPTIQFVETVRRRLVKNAHFVFVLSPAPSSPSIESRPMVNEQVS